jgi:hypothetical protein
VPALGHRSDSASRRGLQKKGVLSEAALPEELRLALAQNMQNDLFYQVRVSWKIGSGYVDS